METETEGERGRETERDGGMKGGREVERDADRRIKMVTQYSFCNLVAAVARSLLIANKTMRHEACG